MTRFTDKDRAEYFHRSYKTVDGLWFVKTEEQFDFNTALDLDREVWKVMPKIQARFLKKKFGVDKIGGVICSTEYGVWGSEFGPDIRFSFEGSRI